MSSSTSRKTLFERVAETSQSEIGRQLGLDKMRISRFCAGATDIDSAAIALCEQAWGEAFDTERTLLEWRDRRLAYLAKTRPEGASSAR